MEAERAARAVEEADARAIAAAEAASMRQVGQHPVSGRCEGDPDHLAEIILSAHAPPLLSPYTPLLSLSQAAHWTSEPGPVLLLQHTSLQHTSLQHTHHHWFDLRHVTHATWPRDSRHLAT